MPLLQHSYQEKLFGRQMWWLISLRNRVCIQPEGKGREWKRLFWESQPSVNSYVRQNLHPVSLSYIIDVGFCYHAELVCVYTSTEHVHLYGLTCAGRVEEVVFSCRCLVTFSPPLSTSPHALLSSPPLVSVLMHVPFHLLLQAFISH